MLCHCRQDTATNLTLKFGWVVCFVSQSILSNLKIAGYYYYYFFFFFSDRGKWRQIVENFFFFIKCWRSVTSITVADLGKGPEDQNEAQRADKERGDRPRPCHRPPFGWNSFLCIPFQRRNSWHSKCRSCFQPRFLPFALAQRSWPDGPEITCDQAIFFFFWHSSRPQSTMHDLHFSPWPWKNNN